MILKLGLRFALLTLALSGVTKASVIFTPPTYEYVISVPAIVSGVESTPDQGEFFFSWVGPLQFNAAPNTACPVGCYSLFGGPKPGYTGSIAFTADLTLSEAEVLLTYTDPNNSSNTVTFSFVEPDSFWATTGFAASFPSAQTGEGASFAIGGVDPPCASCSLETSIASTPEPGSWTLLAFVLVRRGHLDFQTAYTFEGHLAVFERRGGGRANE